MKIKEYSYHMDIKNIKCNRSFIGMRGNKMFSMLIRNSSVTFERVVLVLDIKERSEYVRT